MIHFVQPTTTVQNIQVFTQTMTEQDIIEDCLQRYYDALLPGQSLADVYPAFKSEAVALLMNRELTPDDVEYLLRSYRFVEFVKNLVKTPSSASVPGDVNHVPA